jgi:hypothetical protein
VPLIFSFHLCNYSHSVSRDIFFIVKSSKLMLLTVILCFQIEFSFTPQVILYTLFPVKKNTLYFTKDCIFLKPCPNLLWKACCQRFNYTNVICMTSCQISSFHLAVTAMHRVFFLLIYEIFINNSHNLTYILENPANSYIKP